MKGVLRFLDNDSLFGRICTFVGTLIAANLLFVLTLLPIVTAGAGFCALYYTVLNLVRHKEINPFSVFFKGLRDNFKQGTIAWLIVLLLGAFLAGDVQICAQMTGPLRACVYAIYAVILIAATLAMYLFPTMASFRGSLRDNLKNSVCFIGKQPLYAVAIVVLNIAPLYATYLLVDYLPLWGFLWCLCGFAVIACCNARMLLRLYEPHLQPLAQQEEAADEKRLLEEMRRLEG